MTGLTVDEDKPIKCGLTDEQVRAIKEAILASVYEDIGRSIIKKILWALGAVLFAVYMWLTAHGYIK